MVRLAEYFDPYYNPFWTILQQVGVDAAVSKLDRRFDGEWNNSGDRPWDYAPLHDMKRRYEEAGLELVGIEDYPPMDKARLGLPGGDEETDARLHAHPQHGPARDPDALLQLDGLHQLGAHRPRAPGSRRRQGDGLPAGGPGRPGADVGRASCPRSSCGRPGSASWTSSCPWPRRPACGSRCTPTTRPSPRCAASAGS